MADLSEAFDCLHHELLIAKLNAYGSDLKSMKLIKMYLRNGKQMVKVVNADNLWKKKNLYCIPQGSILGPLIFNIFLYDLFCFLEGFEVASYVCDTIHNDKKAKNSIIKEIEHFSKVLFHWFYLTTSK